MRNISIEVIGLDEVLAENAVKTAVEMLSAVVPLKPKTFKLEPHDDVRGIWSHVQMDNPEKTSASFDKYLVGAFKALINLQLHNVTTTVIHVSIERDEEM
jgi:hypothetical protein